MLNQRRKYTVMLPENLVAKVIRETGMKLTSALERGLTLVTHEGAYERARALRGRVKFSLDFTKLRDESER